MKANEIDWSESAKPLEWWQERIDKLETLSEEDLAEMALRSGEWSH